MSKGRKRVLEPTAQTANADQPAFVARPLDSAVYHGFVVVPETHTDGWVLGEITQYIGADGGDGFVIAPDGSCAGLMWEIGEGQFQEILGPDSDRWGVYAVWFPRAMNTTEDLLYNFHSVLPLIKQEHGRVKSRSA